MIHMGFDSRSREAVGISVGSIFSNTVRVRGPLTNPQFVPKAINKHIREDLCTSDAPLASSPMVCPGA
jgi:hypothetical protein